MIKTTALASYYVRTWFNNLMSCVVIFLKKRPEFKSVWEKSVSVFCTIDHFLKPYQRDWKWFFYLYSELLKDRMMYFAILICHNMKVFGRVFTYISNTPRVHLPKILTSSGRSPTAKTLLWSIFDVTKVIHLHLSESILDVNG